MKKENNGLFTKTVGPFNTVRGCNFCKFMDTVKHTNGLGRGAGLHFGAKAHGRMIQHAKTEHPLQYAAWRGKGKS